MSTEATPLVNRNAEIAKENLMKAADTTVEAAKKAGKMIQNYAGAVKNGNASIRYMALIAGAAVVLDSIVGFFQNVIGMHLGHCLMSFYAFLMGASAIVMEADDGTKAATWEYSRVFRNILVTNIGMVRELTGRAIFYIVAASLEIGMKEFRSKVIGAVMLAVGLAYIFFGKQAERKMAELRNRNYPPNVVKSKFNEFDANGNDRLECKEFHALLKSLDVDINLREAELMYISIPKAGQSGVSLAEFQAFWSTNAVPQTAAAENAVPQTAAAENV